jgi:regulator of replication initiation timing
MLKETQYLRQIERLEEQIKDEAKERKERHDRLIEALREKQKALLDSRNDEISDLKSKVSDLTDANEKLKIDRESLQKQLDKMLEQWRNFKDEANQKYEQYSKQLNQAEMKNEEHNRALITECEKQREETEQMRNERQTWKIVQHELEVKLDAYIRDYERFHGDNKRLRELVN